MKAGLYITATPIGNLGDITLRALETLKAVDAILCEDTRVTSKLLSHYGIEKKLHVYNDHSDEKVRARILADIEAGAAYALVSDAGTPLVSDPGYKLVREARQQNLYVTTLPGASSVTAALTLSGLPSDSFLFIGFLPPKVEGKKKELLKYKAIDTTLIMFERGSRVEDTLAAITQTLGDVQVSVVREISKLYEEVKCNTSSELLTIIAEKEPRGEVVILVSNKPSENSSLSPEELNEKLTSLLYNNSVKDAASIASELYNIPRKEAYEKLLKLKG